MFDTDDLVGVDTSWVREPPAWIDDHVKSFASSYGVVYLHATPAPPPQNTPGGGGMLFSGGVGCWEADTALEEILDCEQRIAAIQAQQARAFGPVRAATTRPRQRPGG
jgi:hypothetical protein